MIKISHQKATALIKKYANNPLKEGQSYWMPYGVKLLRSNGYYVYNHDPEVSDLRKFCEYNNIKIPKKEFG